MDTEYRPISREQFNNAKQHLLKVSQNKPKKVKLKSFQTEEGLFGFFDHKVTGEEINNSLIAPLQNVLQQQNIRINSLFDISDEVYKTIDVLDTEYIAGIQGNVEAATVASNQAKEASEQAKKASEQAKKASDEASSASDKALKAQEDLKKTIEALQQTVDLLKKFKNEVNGKLNNIKHLSDIDATWQTVEDHKSDISTLNSNVDDIKKNNNNVKIFIENQEQKNNQVSRSVKIAYGIAGASLVLSIIQLVLQLIGIL